MELFEKWLLYRLRRFRMVFIYIHIFFFILFNSFSSGKIQKLDFWDSDNSANFKHRKIENHKREVYQPGYHQKTYRILVFWQNNVYSHRFRDIHVRKSVLAPAKRVPVSKKVKSCLTIVQYLFRETFNILSSNLKYHTSGHDRT